MRGLHRKNREKGLPGPFPGLLSPFSKVFDEDIRQGISLIAWQTVMNGLIKFEALLPEGREPLSNPSSRWSCRVYHTPGI